MSLSEFRWNKKRKHYAYLFKNRKGLVFDLIITTKPYRLVHGKIKTNIKLFRHPNPLSNKTAYVIPFIYIDTLLSFYEKVYKWSFNANDKRKIKRLKRLLKRKKEKPTVSSRPSGPALAGFLCRYITDFYIYITFIYIIKAN